jgi:cyclopropane-fatty-acyl-phospholipid synthase
MTADLFLTFVDHHRLGEISHRFAYRTISSLVELRGSCGAVPHSKRNQTVVFNRWGVFSIWNSDFFPGAKGSILQRLECYLQQWGVRTDWQRVELLTSPRFLGYAFNPVSFFLCYENDRETPSLCVAQVNNTFGETHLYFGEPLSSGTGGKAVTFRAKKEFHVSPFYDRNGEYEFQIKRSVKKVSVRVNLLRDRKIVFTSGIKGNPQEMVTRRIEQWFYGAFYGWMTFPRIVWQAALLRFQKQLSTFQKPIPNSPATIGMRKPSFLEQAALRVVTKYLRKLRVGGLRIILPSNTEIEFGQSNSALMGVIKVRDWSFFTRVLFGGDVAFGECYTESIWVSDNLLAVLEVFCRNADFFNDREIVFTKIVQRINSLLHRTRRNSKAGSKNNIASHYDLGNDLFDKFLDQRLVYSCGVYRSAEESLEQAQLNKLHQMIRKADIRADHHVLEIGTGWGAFAVEAARTTGCKVTTVTLSEQQYKFATKLAEESGLSDQITVLLQDYRDVEGKYDRIVSIEMLEAVGHEQLGLFFAACNGLLAPDGIIALQFITVPDSKYEEYRRSCDWIQKYIFPGGLCPSLTAVCNAVASSGQLIIENVENIGPSYARTLSEWRSRFKAKSTELAALGFDDYFQRLWEYYLCYCEAGFANRVLGTLQIVLTRPSNFNLEGCPGYPSRTATRLPTS